MSNQFKLDKNDGVAVLAFDRPEKRNPLNEGSLSELYDHLVALRDDNAGADRLGQHLLRGRRSLAYEGCHR